MVLMALVWVVVVVVWGALVVALQVMMVMDEKVVCVVAVHVGVMVEAMVVVEVLVEMMGTMLAPMEAVVAKQELKAAVSDTHPVVVVRAWLLLKCIMLSSAYAYLLCVEYTTVY